MRISRVPVLLVLALMLGEAFNNPARAEMYDPIVYIRTRATPAGGTAATGDNQLVKGVRVDFWDDDVSSDDFLGTEWTSNFGNAQVLFNDWWESPDIYVKVIHRFKAPDRRKIRVRDQGSTTQNLRQCGQACPRGCLQRRVVGYGRPAPHRRHHDG